ncbi:MAG: DUF58 domain-containing protein [Anaerolineales bacterium]|nr:DUF58 domain-containing protein [Anaerolineales bacterium]
MISSVNLKSRVLPILIVILFLAQLIEPYKGWVILLVGLGGVFLLSYLWARSLAENITIKREMRFGWMQVGDQLEERFTLINNGWFPGLWVEIHDRSDIPDYHPGRVASVGTKNKFRWRTRGTCNRRGMFTLGPTELNSSDPFGFFEVTIQDPASTSLMVIPPIIPLPAIDIAPGGRAGEGRPRQNAPERTVSATSVREYSPEESFRWIHWPTSARKDNFYVRLFESTPSSDWWIALDLNNNVLAGQGHSSTDEHSVILAASLADRGIRHGYSVGLVAHGSQPVWLSPQDGNETRYEILRALALVEVGENSLHDLLTQIRPSISHNSSLIVITSDVSTRWISSLLPFFRRGIVPTVIILDPNSFGKNVDFSNTSETIMECGISHYIITADLLDRPEARPGKSGNWEWRISPSGRAIPIKKPGDMDWEKLS